MVSVQQGKGAAAAISSDQQCSMLDESLQHSALTDTFLAPHA